MIGEIIRVKEERKFKMSNKQEQKSQISRHFLVWDVLRNQNLVQFLYACEVSIPIDKMCGNETKNGFVEHYF